MKIFVKTILSLFIVFHLLVIIILGNGSSYLGRSMQTYLTPYANAIGLNSNWNFFAPDPAHTMYFKYTITYGENQDSVSGFYPPEKSKIVTDTSKRRFLYAMRYLVLDPRRMDLLLGPWLCREYKGAKKIYIEHIMENIPSLDAAVTSRDTPMENFLEDHSTFLKQVFDCELQMSVGE